MDLIKNIVGKLNKYPDLTPIIDSNAVSVAPSQPNGFSVSLEICGNDEFIVYYDGWHDHFSDSNEAADCFVYGLIGECRLKVSMRGAQTYRWDLQTKQKDRWVTDSTTGLLLFAFWQKKSIQYLSNTKT